MNTPAYERRKRGENDWTGPQEDLNQFIESSKKLVHNNGPLSISVDRGPFSVQRPAADAMARLENKLDANPAGTLFVVSCNGDKRDPQYAFRKIEVKLQIINTEGSPAIDKIYTATVNKYPEIYSLGIYADKPGEHGATGSGWRGNAWDIGVPGADSPDRRKHLDMIAQWLRQRGMDGDLPIGGIISQAQWCSKADGWSWQPYHSDVGDLHYTHIHLSGSPEQVPGWI